MAKGDLHHVNYNEMIDHPPPCSYEALGSTFTYRTLGLSRPLASWRLTDFFGASAARAGAVTQVSVARAGGNWQGQRRGREGGARQAVRYSEEALLGRRPWKHKCGLGCESVGLGVKVWACEQQRGLGRSCARHPLSCSQHVVPTCCCFPQSECCLTTLKTHLAPVTGVPLHRQATEPT